jgi:hypothetical protein
MHVNVYFIPSGKIKVLQGDIASLILLILKIMDSFRDKGDISCQTWI